MIKATRGGEILLMAIIAARREHQEYREFSACYPLFTDLTHPISHLSSTVTMIHCVVQPPEMSFGGDRKKKAQDHRRVKGSLPGAKPSLPIVNVDKRVELYKIQKSIEQTTTRISPRRNIQDQLMGGWDKWEIFASLAEERQEARFSAARENL